MRTKLRWTLILTLGFAFPSGAEEAAAPEDGSPLAESAVSSPGPAAASPVATAEESARNDGFRIGFWEIDLLAVDREPRGSTVRLLDFRIFKLLEAGQGPDYQSFRFFEMPDLLHLFSTSQEGESRELRVLDFEAIGLAATRQVAEDTDHASREYGKLPVLGSLFSVEWNEEQPTTERQTYLFLVRRDVPR